MNFTDNHFRNALELFAYWNQQAEIQRKSLTYAIVGLLSTPIFTEQRAKNSQGIEFEKNWPYVLREPLQTNMGTLVALCCDYIYTEPTTLISNTQKHGKHKLTDQCLLELAERLSQENTTMQLEESAREHPNLYK